MLRFTWHIHLLGNEWASVYFGLIQDQHHFSSKIIPKTIDNRHITVINDVLPKSEEWNTELTPFILYKTRIHVLSSHFCESSLSLFSLTRP